MTGRLAGDDEVATWRDDGWVLLDGLVGADEIDAAIAGPPVRVPDGREVPRRSGGAPPPGKQYGGAPARLPGDARARGRVPARAAPVGPRVPVLRQRRAQPAVRAPRDRRLRRARARDAPTSASTRPGLRRSTRATPTTNSPCTPTATTRSCPPPRPPWWHVETFLYLSDVDDGTAPTHLVSRADAAGRSAERRSSCRTTTPSCTRASTARPACAAHCSRTATTCSTAASTSLRPGSHAVPVERQLQGRGPSTGSATTRCSRTRRTRRGCSSSRSRRRASSSCSASRRRATRCGPTSLLDATTEKYPRLDVEPWRRALRR